MKVWNVPWFLIPGHTFCSKRDRKRLSLNVPSWKTLQALSGGISQRFSKWEKAALLKKKSGWIFSAFWNFFGKKLNFLGCASQSTRAELRRIFYLWTYTFGPQSGRVFFNPFFRFFFVYFLQRDQMSDDWQIETLIRVHQKGLIYCLFYRNNYFLKLASCQ